MSYVLTGSELPPGYGSVNPFVAVSGPGGERSDSKQSRVLVRPSSSQIVGPYVGPSCQQETAGLDPDRRTIRLRRGENAHGIPFRVLRVHRDALITPANDHKPSCRRRDSNPRHADYDSAALTD